MEKSREVDQHDLPSRPLAMSIESMEKEDSAGRAVQTVFDK